MVENEWNKMNQNKKKKIKASIESDVLYYICFSVCASKINVRVQCKSGFD